VGRRGRNRKSGEEEGVQGGGSAGFVPACEKDGEWLRVCGWVDEDARGNS
jgi:hypothetical protein